MSRILSKAVEAANNLMKAPSQEELRELWPNTSEVNSASEIYGEWIDEKSTKGFMEVVIKLNADGTGTYFHSRRADMGEWPFNYSLEGSVLTLALEAIDSEGIRYKHLDARFFETKLLLNDNGDVSVYVLDSSSE
ncbi:hypothetical protein PMI15_02852 [Polaromonas sp. CF318]|uniref:hypothetical protein n=1 Tax=Polaromonas sp. CF318 TaxID=1144318 RepID=UPI000271358D|nr:hypothetical protein [Polaromonas sp. CF318]EJL82913.1 hypothetical protein PMI15_02852 [Polaromonas sp. CF318]